MAESNDRKTSSLTKRTLSVVSLRQTSNLDIENLDVVETESSQPTYQIRPQLSEKFKPQVVKELICNVLHDQLGSRKYNIEEANQWSKKIADKIRNKVKELKYRQYKYVINVVLGEQKGAGVKMGTRCLWDAEADSYAHGNFINDTMFCIACVYAIFYY